MLTVVGSIKFFRIRTGIRTFNLRLRANMLRLWILNLGHYKLVLASLNPENKIIMLLRWFAAALEHSGDLWRVQYLTASIMLFFAFFECCKNAEFAVFRRGEKQPSACLFSDFNPSLADRSANRLSQSLTEICSEVIERSRTRASESPVELFSWKVAKSRHYTQQRESPPQGGNDLKRGTSVKVFIFSKTMFLMLMSLSNIFFKFPLRLR